MSQPESQIGLIRKTYLNTLQSIKNYPLIFIPFLALTLIEALSLFSIYLAPRMPLRLIFGPPIRTIWGERFLHYPMNFLLLNKLASLARMAIATILGSLITGIAVALVFDIHHKKRPKINDSFKLAFKKYIDLFSIVLLATALFYFLGKFVNLGVSRYFLAGSKKLLFLGPRLWLGPILAGINFLLAIFLQAAFAYAIPSVIIGKEKLLKAIGESFLLFKRLFLPTLVVVGLPMLIYVPLIILKYHTVFLISKFFPEFMLWVAFFSLVVVNLIVDPLITISTAWLYLLFKEDK